MSNKNYPGNESFTITLTDLKGVAVGRGLHFGADLVLFIDELCFCRLGLVIAEWHLVWMLGGCRFCLWHLGFCWGPQNVRLLLPWLLSLNKMATSFHNAFLVGEFGGPSWILDLRVFSRMRE